MEITYMPEHVVTNVQTKPVGFAPILSHYFKKCSIQALISLFEKQGLIIFVGSFCFSRGRRHFL